VDEVDSYVAVVDHPSLQGGELGPCVRSFTLLFRMPQMMGKVLCRRSEARAVVEIAGINQEELKLHRLCLGDNLKEKDEGGELPTAAY
jgi:hypothetical protein